MVSKGWLLSLLPLLFAANAQDGTDVCNSAFGLSSGAVEDAFITSSLGEESTPAAGRLNNEAGAWCFSNDSIASHSAVLIIDLGSKRFVSGFGSQGPPESKYPKSYSHVIGFVTSFSLDKSSWEDFNPKDLFFDTDKNETSGIVSFYTSATVQLAQYVKINVTYQVSGSTTVCLRFEIYGCDTTVLPSTSIDALTTPKGKIEVNWKKPSVGTTLGTDITFGTLIPDGYVVLYRPTKMQNFATAATGDRMVSLEDVRLGATYVIQLQCHYKDTVVSCGSTEIEAYPPCPEGFTGGNEYHCFLYLNPVSSFAEARKSCLNSQFAQQLGGLGYLVDDDEKKFLMSRILPKDTLELWLIGETCQENENCCKLLRMKEAVTLEDAECSEEALTAALCIRDHKGEGALLRVSSIEAAEDGSTAFFTWRYEGIGWKTDELQVKMWTSKGDENPSTLPFSTLSNTFEVNADVGVMYSLLLRPAPNIRTEELVYKFIIIDFQEEPAKFGAVLMPVPMSIYIIWSGSLRVTWDEAKAVSKSGKVRLPNKYSVTHLMTTPESTSTEVEVENRREFVLTPIAMSVTYVFKMSCFFAEVFQPCGEISIKTDPPNLVLYKPSKVYVIYEVIKEKLKTWSEAEDDCKQRAGHLTSLLDDAEAKALLKMLPDRDSKMWTGAKLGKKGTAYWTDGQKITDLPMAKSSGVTSSSESCCKAVNEMGKLRLAGSNCDDLCPYICKYTVDEMMTVPSELEATDFTWNSLKVSWSKPSERWLPTFYNVRACLKINKVNCVVENELRDKWKVNLGSLLEFRSYEIEVKAILQPVDVKTLSEVAAITYPKSPVKVSISPKGEGIVNIPMLTAVGFPSATVTATLFQMDLVVDTISGGVKYLPISSLVPEETYKLMVKHNDGDWSHEMDFTADPTCYGMDVLVDSTCYSLVEEPSSFADANKLCSESPDNKNDPSLWLPLSEIQMKEVTSNVGPFSNSWVQKPHDGSISNIGSDAACDKGDGSCCFYGISSSSILCSSCCDKKLPFFCSYKIKETYIGKVTELLPAFVGNSSIEVEWVPPVSISWSIRRFEVEWVDAEDSVSLGKEIIVGATKILLEDLKYGTEYEIRVTPLGAASVRGEAERILITTLDPRTPISIEVDPDGVARVYSPLQIGKGRGSEEVNLRIFKVDGSESNRQFLYTANGQAQNVDVTGLEVGQQYWMEMTPKVPAKMFNYSKDFSAYPSCPEKQIQQGLLCVWAPSETKTWREAYEICRGDKGELLDYKTQKELSQPVKSLLTSYIRSRFWLDMGSEGSAALRDASSTKCPPGEEAEVMCCSYEVSDEGELNSLKCDCCDEPRPFACKKTATISLGDVGNVLVEDVTSKSLTVSWTMASETKWQKPSFLITWNEISSRKKRSTDNHQVVIKDSPVILNDLKPGTKYKLAVAPYTEATKSSGTSKEVTATTADDVSVAGLMDDGCTIIALKISCCVVVILGSAFTVFVFIATRMLYLDCIAQMFAELGTLGAYICILISSAQSYNDDTICLRADATLCVAVSVLIQFFFQVIYLFTFLESLLICSVLMDYLPDCCNFRSLLGMSISGFGIPAIMMIVLAAVANDEFSDGADNCWLDLQGDAMLPSVIPVIVFGVSSFLLLLSVFSSDGPKDGIPNIQRMRGRIFLKSRWGCFFMLILTTACYATGMIGANNRDTTLNYVFAGCSAAMGILMPIIRIRTDDEVREQLKRGLFTSLKDDLGAIRVSPAPVDKYDPHPLLNMTETESWKYKKSQLEKLKTKESLNTNTETVWHQ